MQARWNRLWWLAVACGLMAMVGCTVDTADTDDSDQALLDTDGDGLADDFEIEVGTDPEVDDTDGDGYLDGDEWTAFSNPLDETDYEYAGDYDHFPFPDDLVGEGAEVGNFVADFALDDYFLQQVSLYSLYGNVIHAVSAADW